MVCSNAALNPEERIKKFLSSTDENSEIDVLLKRISEKYAVGTPGDSFSIEEKVNQMLNLYMPSSIKTNAHICRWVEENWDKYQLISF